MLQRDWLQRRVYTAIIFTVLLSFMRETPCFSNDGEGGVAGFVRDSAGGLVAGARVWLRNAQQTVIGGVTTDIGGQFLIMNVPQGNYEIVVSARGFAEQRVPVRIISPEVVRLALTLRPGIITESITVTAEAGLIEERSKSIQMANVIGGDQLAMRAKAVLAQGVIEEAGVHLQRTSPTIGGVFIRGLTGNKINVYVDGVRYTTAAARGGINTFLNLVDPSNLSTVEILRGPRSADYGSDAIGGSLQLITRAPSLAPSGREVHGSSATSFNTADWSFGSNLTTSAGTRTFGVVSHLVSRRVNTLRPGGGIDSHAAVTRFLGLRSDVIDGSRLGDTGFTQYGGLLNLFWTPRPTHSISLHYQRGQQDGGKRYDQLLGGDGNLIADLRNLMLDFFYVRYDKQALGWLTNLMLSYSFNSQREERVNQGGNGNPNATIVHEYERTRVHGIQTRADKLWRANQLRFGAEVYHERVHSPAYGLNPVARTTSLRRPRIPSQARYRSWGVYLQDVVELIGHRLKLVGGLRYSGASYRACAGDAPVVSGKPLWSDDSLRVDDATERAGALVDLGRGLSLSLHVSRGFRAPHITDLGTLGLTGSGFEVAQSEASRLGGQIGSTADSSAVSTGRPVAQVKPEVSLSYDASLRYHHERVKTEFAFFINDVSDLIQKQALILPPGAVGQMLGAEPIVAQNPNGTVFVALSSTPVLVRANFGDVRIWGLEHTFELGLTRNWSVGGLFTYLQAQDKLTGQPPNVEGGTPAPDGWLRLRYTSSRRSWVEPYLHVAGRQSRLSSLALEDRRTGATRTRTSISSFFLNGATVRGLVGAGPDGKIGTADDVLKATGETLAQVQNRILGVGVARAPLFPAIPGYVTINLRGGFQLSDDQQVTIDFENLTDRNYRGISWGMDAPGRGFYVRYQYKF